MLDPALVHFNARCVSVSTTASGSHVLHFAGGDIYEADLVIGADGITSTVRNFVSEDYKGLAYSNTVAYRAVVPAETLEMAGVKTDLKIQPLCWVGLDRVGTSFMPPNSPKSYFSISLRSQFKPRDLFVWLL
jgi:salicylate hydroxylase